MANSSGTTHIVGPLAEEQARLGCDVSVFCVEKGLDSPLLSDKRLVESCCFRQSLPLNNPGVSVELARALRRRICEFDIVHVHAIWNFPTWWAMRTADRAGVPYVVAPQGSLDAWALRQNQWGKKLYGSVTELPLLRRAAGFQALTEKEADQIRDFGIAVCSEVIPNGIGESLLKLRRSPNPAYFGLPEDCRTLLFLSRVHPKKGLELVVAAAQHLCENQPELRVIVAGGDAGSGYLREVEAECSRRGLSGMFVFLGEVEGGRKREILSSADAFILPSYSEGMPVAVLEALASGLPVVVSEECNLPEVGEHGAGYIVPFDASRIAEAIQELFAMSETERQQMGEQGTRLVDGSFTWPRIAGRTLDWYKRVVETRAAH